MPEDLTGAASVLRVDHLSGRHGAAVARARAESSCGKPVVSRSVSVPVTRVSSAARRCVVQQPVKRLARPTAKQFL
ncbi:MAG: hypothetical protein ACLPUG_00025 [Acidimicrobiales bacterium]